MLRLVRTLGLLALATPVSGQTVRAIPPAVDCPRCRIVAEKVGTITHDIESAGRVSDGVGTMDSRGRVYLVSDWRRWQLDVYDSTGRHLKRIGARGAGPGEFQSIRYLFIEAGDTVHVIDHSNARRTVLSPSTHEVVRSENWKGAVFGDLQRLGPMWYVGANASGGPSRNPHAVGVLDDTGRVSRMIDSVPLPPNAWRQSGLLMHSFRAPTPDGNGGIFSAHVTNYRIDQWSASGRLLTSFERDIRWFPRVRTSRPVASIPDGFVPYVHAIRRDTDGLLWIFIRVRDPRWRKAIVEVAAEGGKTMLSFEDQNLFDDTVVEVLDPKSARIVGTARFDEAFVRFLRTGYVMSASDDPEPSVTIWRLRLVGR